MKRCDSDRNFVDKFSDVSMSCSKFQKLSSSRERKVCYPSGRCRSLSKSSHSSRTSSSSSSSSVSSLYSERSADYIPMSESRSRKRCFKKYVSPRKHRRDLILKSKNFQFPHCDQPECIQSSLPLPFQPDDDSITSLSSNTSVSTNPSVSGRYRSPSPPCRALGVLPMEYWERSPGCREAKLDHMEKMDHFCGDDREYLILQTTLWNRYHTMERNMFPYDTPDGIEHWTLWCRDEMSPQEVCDYVNRWLCKHMPHVRRWNYDDNSGDRSINLFHVHVYVETDPYRTPDSLESHESDKNLAHLIRVDGSGDESASSNDNH